MGAPASTAARQATTPRVRNGRARRHALHEALTRMRANLARARGIDGCEPVRLRSSRRARWMTAMSKPLTVDQVNYLNVGLMVAGVYAFDTAVGFRWLFFLSFSQVLLEFPLNHVTFTAIGKEAGGLLRVSR